MKKFCLMGLLALSISAQAQTVFFGGDFDDRNALSSQVHTTEPNSNNDIRVYDDFTLSGDTLITGVFGNFLDATTNHGTKLYWEIRSGVSEGNGGTVVHPPTLNDRTVTFVRTSPFPNSEYHYESNVTPFVLGAGTYFLTVAVYEGNARTWLCTASGANGVGGPLANGNSFVDSPQSSWNFRPAKLNVNLPTVDFSMGLRGMAVPEPTTIGMLGLGTVLMIRKRRSR